MSEIIDSNLQSTPAQQEALPGAGGILTTGILSIVFAGLIGMILAIVTLSNAKKPMEMYREDPSRYLLSSYKQVKAGRTCAIIGLSLLGFVVLLLIVALGLNA